MPNKNKNIEVEIKAEIKTPIKNLEEKILEHGSYVNTQTQKDIYFNHPSRDFAQTDEALRIRKTNNKTYLTYKGTKLDKVSKSREEIETPISNYSKHKKILTKLGFKPVEEIKKTRKKYKINQYKILIDKIDELGTYIEIETETTPNQYKKSLEGAKKHIKKLGFTEKDYIQKSYLEMKLEKTEQ
ncbi:Adenylate cyclase CyaB, class 2 (thermophilic) [Methanonatronarchaeum thermophilum]|uniref:Adenylate cyclase CyaB, class 2 (Thermophilic) n=1 Tax=Methanonatronarchaeum thermophilum TaxID=1927129 RepID=A0A1Y3GF71_9EURY|nr:class IV adenylate cyclase [Methanonatronarchaeum thermophilum]OUJ18953.1 Adenylate cyclase CyaB, class 2 (thermophilic) [Methanonatronarchaeum thermophilum]